MNVAHRGASGYEPENTVLSFRRALEMGADAIGIDVHVCASGEVVVFHDDTVDRTTDGFGKVSEMNLHALRALDAGKGERIPTLQETLDFVGSRMKIDIELKETGCAAPVREILKYAVDQGRSYDDFFISSFIRPELETMRSLSSDVRLSVLFNWMTQHRALEFAESIGAYSVNADFTLVDADLVRAVHEKGMKLFVWTVNEKEDIDRMRALEVDAIFSNYPDRV